MTVITRSNEDGNTESWKMTIASVCKVSLFGSCRATAYRAGVLDNFYVP